MKPSTPFEIGPTLRAKGDSGSVRLGDFEAMYERLFAEVLQAGEITPEERERLDHAASALGLDRDRVRRLENALVAMLHAREEVTEVDLDPMRIAYDDVTITRTDLARVYESCDDDLPTLSTPTTTDREGDDYARGPELHEREQALDLANRLDERWCTIGVLVLRRSASDVQRAFYESHAHGLPRAASHPLSSEAWSNLLLHPEQDRITGRIFAIVASAALLARISAMRRDGMMPALEPSTLEDPEKSEFAAVQAAYWAAATLGMSAPPIYATADVPTGFEIVTASPPAIRIGSRGLEVRDPVRLAFACGRYLTWFREEHFVCTLVPNVSHLEDLFSAALLIGAPDLPIDAVRKGRAMAIAEAIRTCLEPVQAERLNRLVARFLVRGGVANVKTWARAVDWTSCRAGLLLCGDIVTAAKILAEEPNGEERIVQLEAFWSSDQASELRRMLGTAIGSE